MRVSTSIALLLLAAVTANAAMYIPSGAYCGSNGMKVLVAGTNLLIRSQEDVEKSRQMRLYVHQVSGTGNVTLTNTVVGYDDYGRISSVMWDAYSKSLLVTALTRGWTVSSYYAATNLTAAACPAATSVYLPSGVMCSSSATLVTSADLMLLASSTASSTAACGGTYSLSTTNSPFSNQVGTCPGTVSYMSYDSTAGVVYARATVSGGYRYSVALSAATCSATPTMLPNTTSWCPASSVSSTSPWAKSVLVFDNVNNLFSWVPKYTSGQECIRIGTYSTQGSTVDLLTVTDQCSGGSIASPAGLIYSATGSTLTFKDDTDTSVTFSPCTVAADPVIPSGWTCGGTGAGMVVVGTTFIVRPDVNTNAGTDPMTMQCVVAGTFQSTTGMTWATTTSSASTCGSTVSSITIGLSNATTAVKSVWFNMIRGGYLEGYTFASDLCTVAPVAVASKIYNVSLSNGAWGPLVVDSSSYATLVANGSWSGTTCSVLFAGAQLSVRSGRVSFVVNATNAMCFTTLVLFDVQISTTAALSFNLGTTYSSALWTTTMTPTAGSLDGMYCGALQSTLTVTGSDYIYREPGTIVIGSLWGSGADWWANVQGYTSGSSGIKVLHIGSASGVLTISLSNGATKTMSAAQCTATTAWSYPATASYCASNVLGMSLSLSTALGGFSLALIDPTKSTQCAISGQLVVGPSGVTTFATMISSLTCPTNLGVFSIAFGTSGLTAVVSNGTSTASVTATSSSCATTPLANGLYCQPNTTLLTQASTSSQSVFVMIAGNELTLSSGMIFSTNFTLNSTGAIVLDQLQPVSITKTFWLTAVGSGATTSGIWFSNRQSNIFLTQANCGAATATNPSTWNTIMTTAAPVAELGAVTPVLVFDYNAYTLYFPNATSTSYDCTIQGSYVVSNMIASYSFTISASCPTLNNITGMTATTSGVTVGLIVGGKAVSIDFAASNCKATGVATAGRHCASSLSTSAVYACADLYFVYSLSSISVQGSAPFGWSTSLTSFGKLMASSSTNTTAWPSARITGVPSQGNTLSITAGTGDLLWSNDASNNALSAYAASFCSANLITPTQVAASWPADMNWQQYLPVGPYCGKRTGDTSVIATSFPMVLSQTLISLPNNTVYLNLTAPGQVQACTVTGVVLNVRPGTGEVVIGFATSSTGQGCTFGGLYTQSYTQFTSAYFTAATNTLSLTGFTFGNGAPAPFSYTLAGGNCADRVAVAATPAMPMVQTIQQGTFNGTTPTASITLVTIGNVFALSLTTATGVTSAGGTYANTTVTPSTSSAVTPLMFTINSVNGLTFYNASALPSAGYAPTLDILSGVEYVTVLGYLGQSASVSGAAAGDSSSSDDDNKTKIIIAVIVVVVVAAVIGAVVMLKRGGGGGSSGGDGDSYQQMSRTKV